MIRSMTMPKAKNFMAGTHRTVPPATTFSRVRPYLPELGITRIANVTGLDVLGIPTLVACRPNGRSWSMGVGKGLDYEAARTSAVMEAIEQHHAESFQGPLRLASWEELSTRVPVSDVVRFPLTAGPRPFTPHTRILWAEGRELRSGRSLWVPYELVHLDMRLPLPEGSGYFLMTSSGLASGNHPIEAICHGLHELVERDAATMFHLLDEEARSSRRLDVSTVSEPMCEILLAQCARADIMVALWDLTSDVGIPVVKCELHDRQPSAFRPIGAAHGYGCHPDASVALSRALTEAAQSRLTRIVASRDDATDARLAGITNEESIELSWRRVHSVPSSPMRDFTALPSRRFSTLDEDLQWTLERLHAAGMGEAIVVDLSRARYPVFVVRVLVPGLESLNELPGWVPGARAHGAVA